MLLRRDNRETDAESKDVTLFSEAVTVIREITIWASSSQNMT